MNAKGTARLMHASLSKVIILLAIFSTFNVPVIWADSASYFYDDLGRLSRVIKGTSGTIYNYDNLGNLISITSATTTTNGPVLTGITPNVLFVGNTMLVTITGQNLLSTKSVTSSSLTIYDVTATDTQISAMMKATSFGTGTASITVTTTNGSANTSVTLSNSALSLSPGQLAITPGGSGTMTASIIPPINVPLTINLVNSIQSVASIPQSITIPISGSAGFTVNALTAGNTTISAGNSIAVVFVNIFTGAVNGLISPNISVSIDAPAGTSPTTASAVSVALDAPVGTSPSLSSPVSVIIDAAATPSPVRANSVSVSIDVPPGASPINTSPISISIDAPPGASPTVTNPVSVKIQ